MTTLSKAFSGVLALGGLFGGLVGGAALVAHAEEHPFQVNGKTPYIVVTSSGQRSELAPGIYAKYENGETVQVIAGEPLDRGTDVGILQCLSQGSSETRQFPSLAVVDGKLYLIARNSSAKGQNKPIVIEIGGPGVPGAPGAPVRDMLSQMVWSLPRIGKPGDIGAVATKVVSMGSNQLVTAILSLRKDDSVHAMNPNETPGVTFALVVDLAAKDSPLVNDPIFLDHRYFDADATQALNPFLRNGFTVEGVGGSRTGIQLFPTGIYRETLARLQQENQRFPVSESIAEVEGFIRYLDSAAAGKAKLRNLGDIPKWVPGLLIQPNGNVMRAAEPLRLDFAVKQAKADSSADGDDGRTQANLAVVQQIDFVTNALSVMSSKARTESAFARSKVDGSLDGDGKNRYLFGVKDLPDGFLLVVNGTLYLMAAGIEPVALQSGFFKASEPGSLKRISAVFAPDPSSSTVTGKYTAMKGPFSLIVSAERKNKANNRTQVFHLVPDGIRSAHLQGEVGINKKFYPQAELALRVRKEPGTGRFGFDEFNQARRLKSLDDEKDSRAKANLSGIPAAAYSGNEESSGFDGAQNLPLLALDDLVNSGSSRKNVTPIYESPTTVERLFDSPAFYSLAYLGFTRPAGQGIKNVDGLYLFGSRFGDRKLPEWWAPGFATQKVIGQLLRHSFREHGHEGEDPADAARAGMILDADLVTVPVKKWDRDAEDSSKIVFVNMVLALDPHSVNGKDDFELLLVSMPYRKLGDTNTPILLRPSITRVKLNFPFSRLRGAKLYRTRGSYEGAGHLVLAVSKASADSVANVPAWLGGSKGGIGAIGVRLSPEIVTGAKEDVKAFALGFATESEHSLLTENADIDDILQRTWEGNDGRVYFSLTPELGRNDPAQSVIRLTDHLKLTPIATSGGKFNFLTQEQVEQRRAAEEADDGAFRAVDALTRTFHAWEIVGEWELEERFGKSVRPSHYNQVQNSGEDKDSEAADAEGNGDSSGDAQKSSAAKKSSKKGKGASTAFANLQNKLDALADLNQAPRKVVMIVSEEEKVNLHKEILGALYPRADGKSSNFSLRSKHSSILIPTEEMSQESFRSAFARARSTPSERSVMILDASTLVNRALRPEPHNRERPVYPPMQVSGQELYPHVLRLLGTEGDLRAKKNTAQAGAISQLIVATPGEWRFLREQGEPEIKAQLMPAFEIDSDYLAGPWTAWPSGHPRAAADIKEVGQRPPSPDDFLVFPGLMKKLQALAQPDALKKHQILIVPERLKRVVWRMALGLWNGRGVEGHAWSHRNGALSLNIFRRESATTQAEVFGAYFPLTEQGPGRNAVMLAKMEDVLGAGRPSGDGGDSTAFRLEDPAMGKEEGTWSTSDAESNVFQPLPHAAWLIASSGRRLQPASFLKQVKEGRFKARIPALLIGTEEELARLHGDAKFEDKFGLFEDAFETTELEVPTIAMRAKMLRSVVERYKAKGFNYYADLGGLTQSTDPVQLLDEYTEQIVNRSEQKAIEFNEDPTTVFMRLLGEFQKILMEDQDARRTGRMDRKLMDRLIQKVFPSAISRDSLPEKDPLRVLTLPQAPQMMQDKGYNAEPSLIRLLIASWLEELRPTAGLGREIPGSRILFGGSGTGKTYAWEVLVKDVLKLKVYDFNNPNDENVWAFRLDGQNLRKSDDANTARMSIEQGIAHFNNFLAMPNGPRGAVLFDDPHKMGDESFKTFLQFLQTLLDSAKGNGLYPAKRLDTGEIRWVPLRNLKLWITINPKTDSDILRKYRRPTSKTRKDILIDTLVATFSVPGFDVEPSLFARIGGIIDFAGFSTTAKTGKLAEEARSVAKTALSSRGNVVVVSPKVVEDIVKNYPDANAREFLGNSVAAVLERAGMYQFPRGKVVMVQPKEANSFVGRPGAEPDEATLKSLAELPVNEFVERTTRVVAADSPGGNVILLSQFVAAMRNLILERLALESGNRPEFAGNDDLTRQRLGEFLSALVGHFQTRQVLPLTLVGDLDPRDLGVDQMAKKNDFLAALRATDPYWTPYFPFQFGDEGQVGSWVQLFNPTPSSREMSRIQVLTRTYEVLHGEATRALALVSRIQDPQNPPSPEAWIQGLQNADPVSQFSAAVSNMMNEFFELERQFYAAKSSIESRQPDRFPFPSFHELARLYFLALDRAIIRQSWGQVFRTINGGIELAGVDGRYSTSIPLNRYLFEHRISLFRTPTAEAVFVGAATYPAYDDFAKAKLEEFKVSFAERCDQFFLKEGEEP